jgi:dTDP-glucose 4,6-dehydratase
MFQTQNLTYKTCFSTEDLRQLSPILNQLKNKKIFITGGTGYMGKCLLDLLIQGNHELQLNLSITILTRDIKKFQSSFPLGKNSPILNFLESDIRQAFDQETKGYDFIIHAATPAATNEVIELSKNKPEELLETITDGSHQVLNVCKKNKDARCLYISSGAVYRGINDHKIFHEQDWNSRNNIPADTDPYMLGKRAAESLFFEAFYNQAFKNFSIARCFTFIGPYLPLGIHLAGSSFFTNIAKQEPITVNSDGTALRSFMHSYDLAVWLTTILIKGKAAEVYNVGSDEVVTIKDFAKKISTLFYNHPIIIKEEVPCDPSKKYYLPNINKARQELGLELKYELKQSIQDAAKWYELLPN